MIPTLLLHSVQEEILNISKIETIGREKCYCTDLLAICRNGQSENFIPDYQVFKP